MTPTISASLLKLFAAISKRHLRAHFHALRILSEKQPKVPQECPVVIYLNHPSWWDPLVALILSQRFFPQRSSYAPIEADSLKRYAFFKRLGFYGVQPGRARAFLRTSAEILAQPDRAIWITPQGRFTDVRQRPPKFEPGLAALALRCPGAAFIPLALEYTPWTEPRPEILAAFGPAIIPKQEPARDLAGWTAFFEAALSSQQDAIAAHSLQRDPSQWQLVEAGNSRVHGLYDVWRGLKARLRGEHFSPEHQPPTGEATK